MINILIDYLLVVVLFVCISMILIYKKELKISKEQVNCKSEEIQSLKRSLRSMSHKYYNIVNPKEVVRDPVIYSGDDCEPQYDLSCPNCKSIVGDYEWGELHFNHCPNCGQRLRYTTNKSKIK